MHLPQKGIIELRDVSVSYDRHPIFTDINLSIDEGDFVAITGPNGGGKTTLLRLLLRLLRPDSGRVIYRHNGTEVKDLPIGYLPQKSMIDTHFPITVEETIASGLIQGLTGRLDTTERARLEETVSLMGVTAFRHQTIGSLSGGQLQRTLLARAIISKPRILVLDEPLSYVDKHFEQQIYSLMEEMSRHTTIILVSHEMSIISGMANRHLIVDKGIHTCSALNHYTPGECQ